MTSSSSFISLALIVCLLLATVVNGQPPVNSTVDEGACCAPLGTNRKQQDNICKGTGSEPSGLICIEEFCVDGTITDSCCVIPCETDADCPGEIHECRETGPTGNKRKGCTFGEFTDAFEKLCIAYPTPFETLYPERPLGTCCNKPPEIMNKPTLQNEWCGSLGGNRICASKFCNGDDCCAIPCNNDNDCVEAGTTCELVDGTRACTFNGSNGACKGGDSFISTARPPSSSSGSTVGGGGGSSSVGGSSSSSTFQFMMMVSSITMIISVMVTLLE